MDDAVINVTNQCDFKLKVGKLRPGVILILYLVNPHLATFIFKRMYSVCCNILPTVQ